MGFVMSKSEFADESPEPWDETRTDRQNPIQAIVGWTPSPGALKLITILSFCLAAGAAFWLFSTLVN
jgi:hypothetical protein